MNSSGTAGTWAGRRVLVTGHTGFKGAWLALWLAELGARVSGLALDPPTAPNLYDDAGIGDVVDADIRGDVTNPAAVDDAIADVVPEVVFHLAAQSIVLTSYADPRATFATNVMGTVHVLDALRLVGRPCVAVVVISDKVYADTGPPGGNREDDRLGGADAYSASKASAEQVPACFRRSYGDVGGLRIATVRAGNVTRSTASTPGCARSSRNAARPTCWRSPPATGCGPTPTTDPRSCARTGSPPRCPPRPGNGSPPVPGPRAPGSTGGPAPRSARCTTPVTASGCSPAAASPTSPTWPTTPATAPPAPRCASWPGSPAPGGRSRNASSPPKGKPGSTSTRYAATTAGTGTSRWRCSPTRSSPSPAPPPQKRGTPSPRRADPGHRPGTAPTAHPPDLARAPRPGCRARLVAVATPTPSTREALSLRRPRCLTVTAAVVLRVGSLGGSVLRQRVGRGPGPGGWHFQPLGERLPPGGRRKRFAPIVGHPHCLALLKLGDGYVAVHSAVSVVGAPLHHHRVTAGVPPAHAEPESDEARFHLGDPRPPADELAA